MSALVSEHSRFQIKEAEAGTPYFFRKANDLAYCVMCRCCELRNGEESLTNPWHLTTGYTARRFVQGSFLAQATTMTFEESLCSVPQSGQVASQGDNSRKQASQSA